MNKKQIKKIINRKEFIFIPPIVGSVIIFLFGLWLNTIGEMTMRDCMLSSSIVLGSTTLYAGVLYFIMWVDDDD